MMRPRAKAVSVVSSCGDMALFPAPVAGLAHLVEPLLVEVFFETPPEGGGDGRDVGLVAVGAGNCRLVHRGPSLSVCAAVEPWSREAVQRLSWSPMFPLFLGSLMNTICRIQPFQSRR